MLMSNVRVSSLFTIECFFLLSTQNSKESLVPKFVLLTEKKQLWIISTHKITLLQVEQGVLQWFAFSKWN